MTLYEGGMTYVLIGMAFALACSHPAVLRRSGPEPIFRTWPQSVGVFVVFALIWPYIIASAYSQLRRRGR